MPRSRRVWSSWNYLAGDAPRTDPHGISVTYWMNRLQGLNTETDYFVSLNPLTPPRPDKLFARFGYHHPVFDQGAVDAQHFLPAIQGRDRIWFCGSYWGYGFHEDALRSSVELAERLGVYAPWGNSPSRDLGNDWGEPTTTPALSRVIS